MNLLYNARQMAWGFAYRSEWWSDYRRDYYRDVANMLRDLCDEVERLRSLADIGWLHCPQGDVRYDCGTKKGITSRTETECPEQADPGHSELGD